MDSIEAGREGGLDYRNTKILKKTNARDAAKLYYTLFLSLVSCDCNLQADVAGARPTFDIGITGSKTQ